MLQLRELECFRNLLYRFPKEKKVSTNGVQGNLSHFQPSLNLSNTSTEPNLDCYTMQELDSRSRESIRQHSFSCKSDSTWGLPSASSCSSRLFLAIVTSASSLSYSLHDRSSSWFGKKYTLWMTVLTSRKKNSHHPPEEIECQSPAWMCGNVLHDSLLWLWRALCRCWAGRSAVSPSAAWHSAGQRGYQSPSLSPGWLTAVLSPGCAEGTQNIWNTHTAWECNLSM